jgi:cell division protein ZapA
MAALTIADELGEMASRLRRLEDELMAVQEAQVASTDRHQTGQASAATLLNAAAERIESVTKKLNTTVGANTVALG